MLKTLHVKNIGVLKDVEVDFLPGLVCLTGETGAGKSLLVDALKLLLGVRPDGSEIRSGESEALIEGVFDLSSAPGITAGLVAAGYEADDGAFVLRRTLSADGRTRAWIQGRLATGRELRDLAGRLVSVTSQHAFLTLADPAERLAMLDAYGDLDEEARTLAEQFAGLALMRNALAALRTAEADQAGRCDYLEHVVREIEAVGPEAGELGPLQAEAAALRHGERLREQAAAAQDMLYDGQAPAFDALSRAHQVLHEMAAIDTRIEDLAARLDSCRIEAREVTREIAAYAERLDLDPGRLAVVETRLEALKSLARRFGGTVDAVLERLSASRRELADLTGREGETERLAEEAAAAETKVADLAHRLSARRTDAAARMSANVTTGLRGLAMEGATFTVALTPVDLSASGVDRTEFVVETNPGEGAGRVTEIASGGELSRITLALYAVLSASSGSPVLVYDEIDAGLSSAVAERIGDVLAGASKQRQILVVTHHAAVAARADQHLAVAKETADGRTCATVTTLDADGRLGEVARMLGGVRITPKVLAHARELLTSAGKPG